MPINNKKPFQPKIDPNYVPNAPKEVLDKPISALNIYPETQAKLEEVGIKTIFDVAILEMKYLYRINNMSKKDVFAVMRGLHSIKLDFKKSDKPAQTEDGAINDEPRLQNNKPNKQDNRAENRKNNQQKTEPRDNQNQNNDNHAKSNKPFQKNEGNNNNFAQKDARPNNAPPQRERLNTREDFNENGTIKAEREKVNSRDFDRNGKRKNINQDKNNNQQKQQQPIKKPPIKLPPLIIEDGLYKFYKMGKWGYKDDKGNVLIEPQYDEAYNFSEGMAGVELRERVGFINKAGELVIDAIYDTVCSFTEGLASVTINNSSWYIDKEENKQFDMEFESATPFKNGAALVKKDGKWNFLARENGELRPR